MRVPNWRTVTSTPISLEISGRSQEFGGHWSKPGKWAWPQWTHWFSSFCFGDQKENKHSEFREIQTVNQIPNAEGRNSQWVFHSKLEHFEPLALDKFKLDTWVCKMTKKLDVTVNGDSEKLVNSYALKKTLGKGSFGKVKLAFHVQEIRIMPSKYESEMLFKVGFYREQKQPWVCFRRKSLSWNSL